jgi:hypothetical protein
MSLSAETLVERTAPQHPAPVGLWALWFGVIAAPLFWFGQLLLNYLVTALACYPADTPHKAPLYSWSHGVALALDAAAIVVAVAGCAVSLASWRKVGSHRPKGPPLQVFGERAHFMAVWGLLFSFGFLIAILFETIADVTVPMCSF